MEYIKLSKRFYENNVLEGSKEILKQMDKKISKTGSYKISEEGLILPEILAVLLKTGNDLDIFLYDRGKCPIGCQVTIFNKKENKDGEILKISFDGPVGNRQAELEEYKKQIIEAKNSDICKTVLNELN